MIVQTEMIATTPSPFIVYCQSFCWIVSGLVLPWRRGQWAYGHGVEMIDRAGVRIDRDVEALLGHDPQQVLGSTSAGSLHLSATAAGLFAELVLFDTPLGRDVRSRVHAGLDLPFDGDPTTGRKYALLGWSPKLRARKTSGQITYCELEHVALTDRPAWQDTKVRLETQPTALWTAKVR